MIMVLIGMYQGAMLFAGLALAFNALVFTSTNWGFIILLTFIGAILGLLAGILMRSATLDNVWALPTGSLVVALTVAIFAIAFDFFIFGVDRMHWRGIVALSLISSAPGLIVGWILAQQFAGDRPVGTPAQAERFSTARDPADRAPTFSSPREPLPPTSDSSDFSAIRSHQLERTLKSEVSQFPPDVQVGPPEEVRGSGGDMCVTATLSGRGRKLKLYLICAPDYPDDPPRLMIEQIDQLQGTSSEVRYRSQVIQQWGRNNRLRQVVEEVYRDFGR